MSAKANLLITCGDAFSINTECLYPLLRHLQLSSKMAARIVFIGSKSQWRLQEQMLGYEPLTFHFASSLTDETLPLNALSFVDLDPIFGLALPSLARKWSEESRGRLAVLALEEVRHWLVSNHKNLGLHQGAHKMAWITGPIDKHACALAGFKDVGQTEFVTAAVKASQSIMILAGPKLRVGLATNHLPLQEVAKALNKDLVGNKLFLFAKALRSLFHIDQPRVAVCGLNPHAGDNGLLGHQEEQIIKPGIEWARQQCAADQLPATFLGPLPADTVFHHALQGQADGVLAMYHDQGLGPLKTIHFYDAINVTGGLPILRCSPDHGPASDLFGLKKANSQSWQLCFEAALEFIK